MKNKLFIVEGVPCTGKTSTSKFIYNLLKKFSEEVFFYPEGTQNHPADYDFHAFISKDNFKKFSINEQEIILNSSEQKCKGYVMPLVNVSGDIFDKLINYKIYDMLPWDEEYPVMLDKWKEFGDKAKENSYIYVFDCCFLQNPLCETMMRFNMDYEEIYKDICKIYKCIDDLNPVVIYLKNSKTYERIKDVARERDESWLKAVIEYHTNQGYGRSRGYKGFDGYIQCLNDRQEIELRILKEMNIEHIIIENPFEDWERTHEMIIKTDMYR